jgi:tRNA dimethylallyltransferase
MIPLLVIAGPTASGKSRLAVDLCLRYGGEVVSADSMQVYRMMDIGTAKTAPEEMKGVPHHMMSIVDPRENFSVANYVARASRIIREINARGRLPVLAGGTGLYISSLVDNVIFTQTKSDPALRRSLKALAAQEGGTSLLDMLAKFDPESAARLHPNDLARIIRAIEIYKTTGVTMSELLRLSKAVPPDYRLCMVGLYFSDRAALYARINARVDGMFAMGLEEEARKLYSYCGPGATAAQAIGYKELFEYFEGRSTFNEAAERIKKETRRYAKRQMTWFGRDSRINWLDCTALGDYENILAAASEVIDNSGLV